MSGATGKDVNDGKAIFYVDEGRSRPYDLGKDLPVIAVISKDIELSDGEIIPAGTVISVVQAEKADDGGILIGFRHGSSSVVCKFEEITLID